MPGKKENQMTELINLLTKLTQGNQPAPNTSSSKKKKKKKKRGKKKQAMSVNSNDGSVTMSRKELLSTVKMPANATEATGHIDLVPDSFAFLKTVFSSFDRVRWTRIGIHYKPAVGTSYGGLVSFGMDWDFQSADVNRAKISGFTPNATIAAWGDTEKTPMTLPQNRLQSRAWYLPRATSWEDRGPGKIHWAANGTKANTETTLGEFWVTYTVLMYGTNPS